MRAIVCERYGPPAVTMSDLFLRGAQVPWHLWLPMRLAIGLTRPRRPIQGLVLAGASPRPTPTWARDTSAAASP